MGATRCEIFRRGIEHPLCIRAAIPLPENDRNACSVAARLKEEPDVLNLKRINLKGMSVAAVFLLLALPCPVAADPIAITDGFFDIGFGRFAFRTFRFSLSGGQDFAISGQQPDGPSQGTFQPLCTFGPCTTTSPSGTVRIVALGSAAIDGTQYPLTQTFGRENDLFSFSSGTIVIPDATSSSLALTAPFTFAGSLDVFAIDVFANDDGSVHRSHIGIFDLIGQGTATAGLVRTGDHYELRGVTYAFASPTPEPASLLLLATGAAMLIRRRSRRNRGLPGIGPIEISRPCAPR
jgi:hypothetical protein